MNVNSRNKRSSFAFRAQAFQIDFDLWKKCGLVLAACFSNSVKLIFFLSLPQEYKAEIFPDRGKQPRFGSLPQSGSYEWLKRPDPGSGSTGLRFPACGLA